MPVRRPGQLGACAPSWLPSSSLCLSSPQPCFACAFVAPGLSNLAVDLFERVSCDERDATEVMGREKDRGGEGDGLQGRTWRWRGFRQALDNQTSKAGTTSLFWVHLGTPGGTPEA